MNRPEDAFFNDARARFHDRKATRNAFAPFESWPNGRQYLTLLVEVPVTSLAVTAQRLAQRVPGLRAVDQAGSHMTIQEVGFGAPPPYSALQAQFAKVPSFECTLGPLNSFPDAVFAEVRPFEGPRLLRRAARDALPELDIPEGSPERAPGDGGMAPHVTVGYFDTEVGIPEVQSALETTALDPVQFLVTEVVLAAVERPTTECFRWRALARFPLAP